MEMGVQYGCSTRVFLETAKWVGIDIELHSWDIIDSIKRRCVDKNQFHFHKEDITGKEQKTIDIYKPDLIFFDAHPYYLTKTMMQICLDKKIDFMSHDVALTMYESVRDRSNLFKDKTTYGAWELRVMEELIGKEVLTEEVVNKEDYDVCFHRCK